jgi:hypothetical protein
MKKRRKRLGSIFPKRRSKHLDLEEPTLDDSGVPRITNETVAVNREEVLSSARKYIYPLQHSKHKIVLISSALFITAFIVFFSYCTLSLYRFKSSSGFIYGVSKVVPFPVAKAGPGFVAYENYLFELRHYTHYYQTQQKLDFNSPEGKQQLAQYRKQALQNVVNDAYVKQLAKQYKVSVSDKELTSQIALVRTQNRLGSNEKGFEDVLKDNFGWTVNDFKRSLRQEMLAQKVVDVLDTPAHNKAQTALNELNSGRPFGEVATKYSEDNLTKNRGGEYVGLVDKTNLNVPAQVTSTLFRLQPGQTSGIINTGYSLEIVKNIEAQGDKVKAAHILVNFKDISTYTNDQRDKHKAYLFIKV